MSGTFQFNLVKMYYSSSELFQIIIGREGYNRYTKQLLKWWENWQNFKMIPLCLITHYVTLIEWNILLVSLATLQIIKAYPWLVWISGLGITPQAERLPGQFPVRAHTWAAGQVPSWGCARGSRSKFLLHINVFFPSLLPSFPASLKINKIKS